MTYVQSVTAFVVPKLDFVPEYSPGTDLYNIGRPLIKLTFDYIYDELSVWKPLWFRRLLKLHNLSLDDFLHNCFQIEEAVELTAQGKEPSYDWDKRAELIVYAIYARVYMLAFKISNFEISNGRIFLSSWLRSSEFMEEVREALFKKKTFEEKAMFFLEEVKDAISERWLRILQSISRFSSSVLISLKNFIRNRCFSQRRVSRDS